MEPKKQYYRNLADTILKNLEKRQIEGYYFDTSEEAVKKASSFLTPGCSVGFGGSMTLNESGMMDALVNNPDITLFDRSKAKNAEETKEIYRKCLTADYFFMSTNAITADGELVNIDGNGNRLAALVYGPEYVIILAGMNKAVRTVEDAISRVRNIAAPPNGNRLNKETPCAITGVCKDCLSPGCMCSHTVITRYCGTPGRIKILLIGEELGY